jgi:hypothetical protein
MNTIFFETKSGQADNRAVQTLSREVSKIIAEQVKKSLSSQEKPKTDSKK